MNTQSQNPCQVDDTFRDMVEQVLSNGEMKTSRGATTKVIPGYDMALDLSRGNLPLLSLKKTRLDLVAAELWFFIHGLTSKAVLRDQLHCNIWNEWCNPEALKYTYNGNPNDRAETQAKEVDLGPVYGYQWRYFGRTYVTGAPVTRDLNPHGLPGYSDDTGGYDQLAAIANTLRTNPDDRRMVCSAWNPMQMNQMALPPCHLMFNVIHINGHLHLHWFQRSCDVMLGVPFNICSYGLLLHLLALHANLKPGMLYGHFADFHIYENHLDAAAELLNRPSRPTPRIDIPSLEDAFPHELGKAPWALNLFQWSPDDLAVTGYDPHPFVKLQVKV